MSYKKDIDNIVLSILYVFLILCIVINGIFFVVFSIDIAKGKQELKLYEMYIEYMEAGLYKEYDKQKNIIDAIKDKYKNIDSDKIEDSELRNFLMDILMK